MFKSDRLVEPLKLRGDILSEIHGAHMGETKSLSFGRDYVFWRGMTAQIKDKVKSCSVGNSFRNQQQKETLHPHEIPDLPWQIVGTDIFQFQGQQYLLLTDFYSKYFEVELLRQSTASCVNNLKKIFARFLEYLRRLSATMALSTVTQEMCLVIHTSSRNLQKTGVFDI
jgi:hypothetical protein